jgi:hypothetical protein
MAMRIAGIFARPHSTQVNHLAGGPSSDLHLQSKELSLVDRWGYTLKPIRKQEKA